MPFYRPIRLATSLLSLGLITTPLLVAAPAAAQEAVVGAPDADALFTSPDPKLNANKQVVYRMMKDVLGAGHWELANELLTERYLQHNPNVASGRQGVIDYFTKRPGFAPKPIPARIPRPIVAVMAEGDLVTVIMPAVRPDPADPAKTYTTTWYDTFRIVNGKIDEHWDPALRNPPPAPKP